MSGPNDSQDGLLILLPNHNDWESLRLLFADLDATLSASGLTARVLVLDDGSTRPPDPDFPGGPFTSLQTIDVLELRRNLGHQRAIAIGLAYAESHLPCQAVVLMDGDGEDAPADIPRLLDRCAQGGWREVVFAERMKRSESLLFVICYHTYRFVHLMLTGVKVRVGNFSVIPRCRLESLVVVSEMWNHYAASVFKSRQPLAMVPTARARRLRGRSTMNFVQLVVHGLSALSIFSDVIGVRLLVATLLVALVTVLGILAAIAIRLGTSLAIPGWATALVGILSILLSQAIMFSAFLSFVVLSGRHSMSFVPLRDYALFVSRLHRVHPRP